MKWKVTILQLRLPHYRVALFGRLRDMLAEQDIELCLVHGQGSKTESTRQDEGFVDWAVQVKNKYWSVLGRELCWQPFPKDLQDSDMVVLSQENRILSNYPLLLNRLIFQRKNLAYWGHGANLQSTAPKGGRELWKRMLLTQVDWWFAYTDRTAQILKKAGYPDSQITCLNNAIDTTKFQNDLKNVAESTLKIVKGRFGIGDYQKIGLFCGSLYPEKKLNLLVNAADLIHQRIPEFVLFVIGDGPSGSKLHQEFKTRPWAHCVGVKRGVEKAVYFRLAHVMLNPGALGLHILDAFNAGLPLISTKESLHGPEIVYLKHAQNGFLVADNPRDYADTVIQLLLNANYYRLIVNNAKSSAPQYTLDKMVQNFADGIVSFLNRSHKRKHGSFN
jgi:glycosyltransferase involved in cell wall biosynthesis